MHIFVAKKRVHFKTVYREIDNNAQSDHLKSLVTCNNISWSHFIAEFLTPDRTENKNSFTDDNLSFVHFLHTVSVCHTGGFTPDVKDIRSASAVTVCQFFLD